MKIGVNIQETKGGQVIEFPHSAHTYMRVLGGGIDGVISLTNKGEYVPLKELKNRGLGTSCFVLADDLFDYI